MAVDSLTRWNAQMAQSRAELAHAQAVADRESVRDAPLSMRAELMNKFNNQRVAANIAIAKARYDQGLSNWSTEYRGLEYK